jgi:hypothetical protein
MKKRKLVVTGGIVTTLLLSSASPAIARTAPVFTNETKTRDLKFTLAEQGFSASQIQKIYKSEGSRKHIGKLRNRLKS